ncbi:MAG: hypothetical protein COA53_06140 [Rhodobacteraceae bacterium]|nr:MAG: hypothetical protein COA53_06140 [Paracoccaceae bacterium]
MKAFALALGLIFYLPNLGVVAVTAGESSPQAAQHDGTFSDALGHKVRMAAWQEPSGFFELLVSEDYLGIVEADLFSYELSEADYFVLFLSDWSELELVPEFFRKVTQTISRDSDAVFALHAGFRPDGGRVQFLFFNLAAFDGASESDLLCRTVKGVYNYMQNYAALGAEDELIHEILFEECVND